MDRRFRDRRFGLTDELLQVLQSQEESPEQVVNVLNISVDELVHLSKVWDLEPEDEEALRELIYVAQERRDLRQESSVRPSFNWGNLIMGAIIVASFVYAQKYLQSTSMSGESAHRREAGDREIVGRVYEKLARLLIDPSSVRVNIQNGRVTLHGQASERDSSRIVSSISSLVGVRAVENRINTVSEPAATTVRAYSYATR